MLIDNTTSIKKSAADQVADYLRKQIILKELPLGQRLVEANLAKMLGVSITPVRQALMQLTTEGLIVSIPYTGSYVVTIDENFISSLHTCRVMIELEAAKTAYDNMYRINRHALLQIIQTAEKIHATSSNMYDNILQDVAFHRCIIEHSSNKILLDFWNSISSRTMLLQAYAKKEFSLSRFKQNHLPVALCLSEGKGSDVFIQELMQHHDGSDTANPDLVLSIAKEKVAK